MISEEREGTTSNKSSLEKGENKNGWITHRTHYGRSTGVKSGRYDPSTGATVSWTDIAGVGFGKENKATNYYDILGSDESELGVLQSNQDEVTEYMHVGDGIGGGFTNTLKLEVMKYHEAINRSDGEAWKAEV